MDENTQAGSGLANPGPTSPVGENLQSAASENAANITPGPTGLQDLDEVGTYPTRPEQSPETDVVVATTLTVTPPESPNTTIVAVASAATPSVFPSSATFGEKMVGYTFNPSGDNHVSFIKKQYADIIDHLDAMRSASKSNEQKRLLSIAITEAQGAQMWAVKGITWQD